MFLSHLDYARAVLARYGNRTPAPDEPAAPDGREPTDEELQSMLYYEFSASTGHGTREDPIGFARAVLARWGHQPPQPIPLSERQPTEADCDAEGRCLLFGRHLLSGEAAWIYGHPVWAQRFADVYSHWLPHWALPAPGVEA